MKIIFDSNVWRQISTPSRFPGNPSIEDYKKIRKAIEEHKIQPFISETVFTIEAIKKVERKEKIGNRKSKIGYNEHIKENGLVKMQFSIGPSKGINFANNPILKQHFDDAINLGFNIVRFPRIAGFTNDELENVRYIQTGKQLEDFQKKVFEVGDEIQKHNAGIAQIKQIGLRYNSVKWIDGVKVAPDSEKGNIAKAVAEWADGDSVAISIALECDYFCTMDEAKSAGNDSILSHNNLTWLSSKYDFKTISPEKLTKIIK